MPFQDFLILITPLYQFFLLPVVRHQSNVFRLSNLKCYKIIVCHVSSLLS